MRRTLAFGAIAAIALTGAITVPAAASDLTCPESVAQRSTVAAEVVDGLDLTACGPEKTVVGDGVGAAVPEPGTGITAVAIDEDGTESSLTVTTSEDGVVEVTTEAYAAEAGTTAAPANRCSDDSYALLGAKWYTLPRIAVNSTERRPSNISETVWETILGDSLRVIKNGTSSCGLSGTVAAQGSVVWNQLRDANMNSSNACTTPDTSSVVDFGSLSGTTLGLTCVSFAMHLGYDEILSADVRLDNSSRSWVTTTTGCSGTKYDLRSALTHEFGHAYGLNHAAERGGNDLTMSPSIAACNASARTLGLGDFQALLELYPG